VTEQTDLFTTDEAPAPAADTERLPRPRIRTGAVLWGLLMVALGWWVLWIATSAERREDALHAVLSLGPFDWAVIALVTVGALVTLIALAAVIRRAQNRRARNAG